jgi:hypothetical protein
MTPAEQKSLAVCVVADLHLGSLLFDHTAFEKCAEMLSNYVEEDSITIAHLVLLGETLDKSVGFPSQLLRGLSSEWQLDLAAKTVCDFARKIRAQCVDLVSGKGELTRGLSQQRLTEKLLLLGLRASHTPFELKLELGEKQVAFTHTLGRTLGSYAGVVTPNILVENLAKVNRLGVNLTVVGNYRRFANTGSILSLPGFLLDPYSEIHNERGLALLLEGTDDVEIKIFKTEPTRDPEELSALNLSHMSKLLAEIYPYSYKTENHEPSYAGNASRRRRNVDCEVGRGYEQLHTQLPVRLASDLRAALPLLGFGNLTEWVREMARETVRQAGSQVHG